MRRICNPVFLLLGVIFIVTISSCSKGDGISGPAGGLVSARPAELAIGGWRYHFTYDAQGMITKFAMNPSNGGNPTFDPNTLDTTWLFYNADKTLSRTLSIGHRTSIGSADFVTRTSTFFIYSSNRLLKVYEKMSDVTYSWGTYNPIYETQLGPIDHTTIEQLDSVGYDNKGRIAEVFSYRFDNSYGATPSGYFVNPIEYFKIDYKTTNDSLINKITQKHSYSTPANYPDNFYLTLDSFDYKTRNPFYDNFKLAFFFTPIPIDWTPFHDNSAGTGYFLSFNPYLLKTFSTKEGYPPYIYNTYQVTNKFDQYGRVTTSLTENIFNGGGFSMIY